MSDSRNVVIRSINGDIIAPFESVNVLKTTGRELRHMTAARTGFSPVCVQVLLSSGQVLADDLVLKVCISDADCLGDDVTLVCKLSQFQLVGPKKDTAPYEYFGGKGGALLKMRISELERSGRLSVCTNRVPDPSLREEVRDLIHESFAPHLAPLIDVALNAAHDREVNIGDPAGTTSGPHTYEDLERGAFADLSSCQLWTRVFKSGARELGAGDVVAAVLWRLIFGWEGANGLFSNGGPVLEVLFLATAPGMRESGHALELIAELEEAATSMGCSSISVAAVPHQGMSFWSRAGYGKVVLLKDTDDASIEHEMDRDCKPCSVFQEPITPFGTFLFQNMLLFTDTPLLAKSLQKTESAVDNPVPPLRRMGFMTRACSCISRR